MKFLIASDIHGSSYFVNAVIKKAKEENADKIILLGDIYNHGPRNPLPEEYSPMEVAKIFNGINDKLLVVKGNCDSEVDTMISEFDFVGHLCLAVGNKTVFLTHGHVYNKDKMPKTKFEAIIYGHFHTGFIERKGDIIIANTGSTSLPKNDTPNSYMVLENKTLTLKDFENNVIKSIELESKSKR